jgi:hypothetical protein
VRIPYIRRLKVACGIFVYSCVDHHGNTRRGNIYPGKSRLVVEVQSANGLKLVRAILFWWTECM